MRRSICICEPAAALAGDVATWKFSYTSATTLPKGTRLRFDLLSKGRTIDWEIPQTNIKEKSNLIWGVLPDGKTLPCKEVDIPDSIVPHFDFVLPTEIKAGETFAFFLGTPKNGVGNRAQTTIQRRRSFFLYIDPKGKGDFRDPEVFHMDVRGNALACIRVVTPSIVAKNKRFDVIVRFEDAFGNLTSNAPEGTLIELSYEHLRENLSWKLFVPETGFITLPNLYFNEQGVYRIQLHNLVTGDKFYSAPIKCLTEFDRSLYWGLLHGESERFDSTENVESCLRHFRDERSLHFYASSSFESGEETSNDVWKSISTQVGEFNEEGRFITFLGFQWCGDGPDEGLRQILYSKDNKPLMRKKEAKTNTLAKIYKSHTPKEILSIPSLTMGKKVQTNFDQFSPEFERVVEIYNAWGSSECSAKEGNPRPLLNADKKGAPEVEEGSVRGALNRNCRFGFVAGGLDDRGIYGTFYESDQVQYTPGLTAIFAVEQTRDALFQALVNRSCYATTGERIIVGFTIAGALMGSELNTRAKPGLALNRHIAGFVAGTAALEEVALIRCGVVIHTFCPGKPTFDYEFDDSEPISKAVLPSPDDRPPFVYYYLRVIQADGHIAWSSPIWIDCPDVTPPKKAPVKRK
jgi:hypothetical protein